MDLVCLQLLLELPLLVLIVYHPRPELVIDRLGLLRLKGGSHSCHTNSSHKRNLKISRRRKGG